MSSPLTAVLVDSDDDLETYDVERLKTVKQRLAVFDLSTEQLKQIRDVLQVSFEEGLKSEQSVVKMLPTFITSNTTIIKNKFIALDLGGTGFRIYLIGTKGEILHNIITKIPEIMKKGSVQNLMFFIAESLRAFLIEHQLPLDNKFPIGFTFSYPCVHNNLTSATLIKWTKGFCAYGYTGKDIVEVFRDACSLVKLEIGTITLINDTVGTLLACSLNDNSCSVGLVVATGFNIAYMERVGNILKLKSLHKNGNKEICLNTEVGAFGDDGKIDDYKTKFDVLLDNNSINKGNQTFEKMISGMYLCELMRFVTIDLFLAGLIFNDKPTAISLLEKDGFFKTSTMTRISEFMRYSKPLAGFTASLTDCAVLEHISSVICSRSEFLCAAAVAAICQRINKQKIIIGVDSALFCTKRTLQNLESKIECLTEKKIELIDTEEASGRGAAVAAAFEANSPSSEWNCVVV